MISERPRFPVGLTLAAGFVFAICITLGAWQLQRGAWKAHVLAEIAARRDAPPQPIGPVLTRAARGEDVGFTRVVAQCGDGGAQSFKAGSDGSEWVWRAMAQCASPARHTAPSMSIAGSSTPAAARPLRQRQPCRRSGR